MKENTRLRKLSKDSEPEPEAIKIIKPGNEEEVSQVWS